MYAFLYYTETNVITHFVRPENINFDVDLTIKTTKFCRFLKV
jgi:hypothetical protein